LDPALPLCSDGQVIAILQAANQGEIDVAKAVIDRVQNPSVQELAQTIIDDHTAALEKVDQLITSSSIEPIENDNSEELAESADMTIASLQSETGSDLEKSYVAHEIFDHIQTIGTGDHLLGPSATNPQLKATIQAVRPTLVKHLQLASQAQRSISGACGGQSSQTEGDAGTTPPSGR
jgi:putative membrane protein